LPLLLLGRLAAKHRWSFAEQLLFPGFHLARMHPVSAGDFVDGSQFFNGIQGYLELELVINLWC
jgi:hypothetical protein